MSRYSFADAPADWARFELDASAWKPDGLDQEMRLRLDYYLDNQLADLKKHLAVRFPKTHSTMVPHTARIVRHFVGEQAKVFRSGTKLDLVTAEGEPCEADLSKWWDRQRELMGLALRLKKVDAYTTLMRTVALRVGAGDDRFFAHVVFPQSLRIVPDPAAPMDLDRAFGVAIEIASEHGARSGGPGRWEFWCARSGEEQHLIIHADGDKTRVEQTDEEPALRTGEGKGIVPLVLFTAHTEELGLFTLEGSDLVPTNRGINVLLTDIHHIAEQQGFGVMVVTTPAGQNAPPEMVRAPNTAISLTDGTDAKFIDPAAPLGALLDMVERRIKMAAVLYGIPSGAVSIEARAVASGIALQIEQRPLTEGREDAVELYREPVRRFWSVFRAVYDAFASDWGAPAMPADIQLHWTPSESQPPVDVQVRTDDVIARLRQRLISRAEAIAELRGISKDAALRVAKEIDEEEPAPSDPLMDGTLLDTAGKRARLEGGAGAEPPPAEPAGSKAAQVQAVDPTSALNGAQVQALVDVVLKVATGELPRASGIEIIVASFPVSRAAAEQIMGEVGKGFVPTEPASAPLAPFTPKPPEAPPAPAE